MSGWAFHNPVRVQFGPGARGLAVGLVAGRRLLVVTTARGRRQMEGDAPLAEALAGAASLAWVDDVTPNPGLAETQGAIDRLAGQGFDLVLAFGGGSAMDAAKALAAGLAPDSGSRDLAALIAAPGKYLTRACLPILALATTSGTGAEVTPFATIWDHGAKKKLSLASPLLFAQTAIVDPELTHGLPRDPTLSTGLDALNQAFESVWNRNATPLTRGFAGRAIGLGFAALPRLAADLDDHGARAMIAEASLLAGMSISQTRTAVCHAMSYPLTAHYGLPHGWACAATMAAAARAVLAEAPECLDGIAPQAGFADAGALVGGIEALLADMGLRAVVDAHIPDRAALPGLIPEMYTPGRSDNFILDVTADRLAAILGASLP